MLRGKTVKIKDTTMRRYWKNLQEINIPDPRRGEIGTILEVLDSDTPGITVLFNDGGEDIYHLDDLEELSPNDELYIWEKQGKTHFALTAPSPIAYTCTDQEFEELNMILRKTENFPEDAPKGAKYMVIQYGIISYFVSLKDAYDRYNEFWARNNAYIFELVR